jgi:hypothetical protein
MVKQRLPVITLVPESYTIQRHTYSALFSQQNHGKDI